MTTTYSTGAGQATLAEGQAAFRRRDFRTCESICRTMLEAQPGQADTLLLLGNCLQQGGRPQEALAPLQEAAKLITASPDPQFALGMALNALERWAEAEAAFLEALRIAPTHAYAYNNLGIALRSSGRNTLAVACFREALTLDKTLYDAQANLARSLLESERSAEALPHFEALRAFAQREPAFALLYAQALINAGKSGEAVPILTGLVKLTPTDEAIVSLLARAQKDSGAFDEAIHTWTQSAFTGATKAKFDNKAASTLVELGRFEEAIAAYRRATLADPQNIGAWLGLSQIRSFVPEENEIASIEKLSQNQDLPDKDKANVLFALGRSLDRAEQYDHAFSVFQSANAIMHRLQGTDYHTALATHDAMRERFRTIAEPPAQDPSAEQRPRPIFIVGMPRSGTTLVEQILSSHPEVHGAGELTALYTATRAAVPTYPEGVVKLDRSGLKKIADHYLAEIAQLAGGAAYATDKMPINYQRVGIIAEAFPRSPIISLRRDPLDVCISCYTTLFAQGQRFSYDLEELGRAYRLYQDLMEHWKAVVPAERLLEVVYEDLVADPEPQVRRLLEHCGLPWSDACMKFHENERPIFTASASQVRQPLYNSSIGRWRHYEKHLGSLIDALGAS